MSTSQSHEFLRRATFAGGSVYALTKGAFAAFTKGLARDLGPRAITVNNVQPGPIDTDMNPANGEFAKDVAAATARQQYGHVDEIASFVAYLTNRRPATSPAPACWPTAVTPPDADVAYLRIFKTADCARPSPGPPPAPSPEGSMGADYRGFYPRYPRNPRFFSYTRGARIGSTRFSWNNPRAWPWPHKLARLAECHGCANTSDLSAGEIRITPGLTRPPGVRGQCVCGGCGFNTSLFTLIALRPNSERIVLN